MRGGGACVQLLLFVLREGVAPRAPRRKLEGGAGARPPSQASAWRGVRPHWATMRRVGGRGRGGSRGGTSPSDARLGRRPCLPPPASFLLPHSHSLSLAVSGSCIAHRHVRHPDGHTPAERAGGRRASQAAGQGRRRRGEQHFFSARREREKKVNENKRCRPAVHFLRTQTRALTHAGTHVAAPPLTMAQDPDAVAKARPQPRGQSGERESRVGAAHRRRAPSAQHKKKLSLPFFFLFVGLCRPLLQHL